MNCKPNDKFWHDCLHNPFFWIVAAILTTRLCSLSFYPLMDTTEARYAEIARKMLETDNWITPQFDYGIPFWGKPPLATWLTAISFKEFGIHEFAARFPSIILTILTLGLTFQAASHWQGSRFAWLTTTILASTALVFILSGAVLMDPAMTLGTTLSMVSFLCLIKHKKRLWGYLFFVGLAIGLLAKGPISVLLVGFPITVWFGLKRQRQILNHLPWISGIILMLILALPWYLLAEYSTPGFLDYFFIGEHWKRFTVPGWSGDLYGSAHERSHGTIWLFWIAAALPWSFVFLFIAAKSIFKRRSYRNLATVSDQQLFLLLFSVSPMVIFTFAGNILATYVLPGMPAFALLLADRLHQPREGKSTRRHKTKILVLSAFMPVVFTIALTTYMPEQASTKSSKDLVIRFQQLARSAPGDLIYMGKRTFSAQFYSSGQAREITNHQDIEKLLTDEQNHFFALHQRKLKRLPPELHRKLTTIDTFGHYVLLQSHQ